MQPSLYQFFRHQLHNAFGQLGLSEPVLVDYVSELLARFAHTRTLYAVRDREGRPLERLAELFAQCAGCDGQTPDWRRRCVVLRHIGEYALFMSGLFRERLLARGQFGYYCASGGEAFGRCAYYEVNPARQALFRRLHQRFTHIADGLHRFARHEPLAPPPAISAHTLMAALWRV
jgi:hypothetical protein